MKTDALIKKLSGELTPTKRFSTDRAAALIFLFFAVSLVGQFLLRARRPDAVPLLTSSSFFFLGAFFLGGIHCLIKGISSAAIPGRNTELFFFRLSLIPFSLGLLAIYLLPIAPSTGDVWHQLGEMVCVQEALLLSILPVGAVFLVLRRLAVTRPWRAGALVGLLGVAGAGLALSLCCANSATLHVAGCHFLFPAIFASLFSGLAARWLVRW